MRENLNLKIISLLLAVFIWLQTTLVAEHKTVIFLPIALVNIPKNMTFDNLPQHIPFLVRGRGIDIIRLYLNKTKMELDATKIKPGLAKLNITDYKINLPENLEIDLLGPAEDQELMIQSDVFHRKSVPVELSFGDSSTKLFFSSLQSRVFPETVQLFGPKNKLQKISSIQTHKISRNLLNQKEFKVNLMIPDDNISISDPSVKVTIIDKEAISRVFSGVPITTDMAKRIIPSRVTVIVKGTVAAVQNTSVDMIKASLAPEPDANGAYIVVVTVPEDLLLVEITPTKVFVNSNDR